MSDRILIIEADDQTPTDLDNAQHLEQQLRAMNVSIARTTVLDAVGYLTKAVFAGEEPAVVIIGPTVSTALAVARRIRPALGKAHLVFVPAQSKVGTLQRELSRAPMIGNAWSLATLGEVALAKLIGDAMRTAQRRTKLRTTLDRANVQISAPKTIDSADYRRLVVSDHYLANLLTQAQDIIVSLDSSQRVVFMSAGAARISGLGMSDAVGILLSETNLWSEQMADYLKKIRTSTQALTAELAMPAGNSELLMETVFSAVRDDNGQFIGVSLVMRDVTERNRQLEAERLARAEAESIGRLKDDFLTTLSHELRTPLNSILGWAQLLQSGALPEEKKLDGIATIERNARHQAKLIEDLLDISSVITGKLRLQLQPVGLRSVINKTAEAFLPVILAKGLKLIVTSDVARDVVSADPRRLEQVLWNLLSNAVKFTPEGGEIRLGVAGLGTWVQISVADTGEGLTPLFLPHVFERFRQADASITKRSGGLGLGLAIVKQLVEMHGGKVSAISAGTGLGSTFVLALPLFNDNTEGVNQPLLDEATLNVPPMLEGLRILIVDDEPDARHLLSFLFQKYGAETLLASSAAEALQVIGGFNPQLLISDIGMPDVDGYELLKTIRAKVPNGATLPAIALTAFADQANREKALATGFQNHLGKPFDTAELLRMVANLAKAN